MTTDFVETNQLQVGADLRAKEAQRESDLLLRRGRNTLLVHEGSRS